MRQPHQKLRNNFPPSYSPLFPNLMIYYPYPTLFVSANQYPPRVQWNPPRRNNETFLHATNKNFISPTLCVRFFSVAKHETNKTICCKDDVAIYYQYQKFNPMEVVTSSRCNYLIAISELHNKKTKSILSQQAQHDLNLVIGENFVRMKKKNGLCSFPRVCDTTIIITSTH